MPHCIIEYAAPLDSKLSIASLVQAVHQGTFATGLFPEEDIKARAVAYHNYQTGSGQTAFIHVSLRILSGRTDEQKQQLAACVEKQLMTLALSSLSLTIEVIDIHRASYTKQLLP